jgi:hypothetical protein
MWRAKNVETQSIQEVVISRDGGFQQKAWIMGIGDYVL